MQKEELLKQLSLCVEKGKADRATPTPPEMKDQDGAKEITIQLLEMETSPAEAVEMLVHEGADVIGANCGKY
ncbi:MAG: hypothetical protein WD577_05600 [Bacteroidales bacterium]